MERCGATDCHCSSCNPFIQVLSEKFRQAAEYDRAADLVVIPLFRSYRKNHPRYKSKMGSALQSCNPFIQVLSEKFCLTLYQNAIACKSCNPFIQVLSEKWC